MSKRRQKFLILMCFLLYVFSYFARYSYNSNIAVIITDYGITKDEAGLVGTFYFIAYGVFQFVNGMLCKKYNKKYVLTGALIISSILNFIAFLKPPFFIFKYMWLLNGVCLATMWPSLICLLGEHLDDSLLHKGIVIMNTTVAFGTGIIYLMSFIFNSINLFNLTFLFSFVACFTLAIVWFIFCKKDIGKSTETIKVKKENKEEAKPIKASFYIIYIISIFAFLSVIVNLFKDGTNTWCPSILKDTFNYPDNISIILTIVLPVLGIFGSPFALLINKKIQNYILSLSILLGLTSICTGAIVFAIIKEIPVIIIIALGLIALLTHGMNSIITGIVPLEERDKFPSGKMAGILNATSYIGSALSAYGLGFLAQRNGGWTFVFKLFLIIIICSTIIAIISGIILNIKKKKGEMTA